ncbi:EAL domain-containing protein [Coleofasciculus sp. F4-SAH-05]|uniref:EAL domain-containing protein n=1 Tax=Coleofasciculus sp. F4-SAH-05 TaxID=3069525 RepID=UPI003300987F
MNITQDNGIEPKSQKRHQLIPAILNSLDEVVWSASAQTYKLLYINQAAETILGRTLAELYDQPTLWQLMIHPDDRQRVQQQFQSLVESGNQAVEYRIVRPDGEVRWIHNRVCAIADETGTVIRIDGIARDITQRKQAEVQLCPENDLLQGIMQTSIAAITVVDTQGNIIFANARSPQVLGLTQSELVERRYNSPTWQITDFQGGPFPEEQLPFQQVMVTGQPVFDVQHGIEWADGTLKYLSVNGAPLKDADFIHVTEDTGLIIPLGEWVLYEACRQLRMWQTQFPTPESLKISVNLSGKQIKEPELIEQIDQILAKTGLDGRFLKLEITESVLMENAETVTKMLLQLRTRNIQLSVDDFGTGYSSLSYLHRFPVNTLKIDRSFVSKMNPKNRNTEIIRTIITLAHSLKMDVIAEGVETLEQLTELKLLNCEQGQGYLFSKPLTKCAAGLLLGGIPQW